MAKIEQLLRQLPANIKMNKKDIPLKLNIYDKKNKRFYSLHYEYHPVFYVTAKTLLQAIEKMIELLNENGIKLNKA